MATSTEAEESALKRSARRRLIGAIALALAAVIVLPMVFDAEKKPLDADISIQIPNKDAVVAKGPGAQVASPALPEDKAAAGGDEKAAPKADEKAETKAETKSVPKGEAGAQSKGEAKAEAKTADARVPAASKTGDARSAKDLAEEKRAAAILNAQADAATTAKSAKAAPAAGAFAVQVGAFAAAEKVTEVRDKLTVAGIKTYTEKLDTKDGERTRVRAGPFEARESAEAARDQIKGLGFGSAAVVAR